MASSFFGGLRRLSRSERTPETKIGAVASMTRLSVVAGIGVAAMAIPAASFVAVTGNDVSTDIVNLPLTLDDQPNPQTTQVLAADGSLLAYFYEENRQDVPIDDISPVMQEALLSIEDSRFYEHGALDVKGTFRALVNNAADGQTQGGSSITQQLVKLTLLSQATTKEQRLAATEQSTARKIRELKLAVEYEKDHSKTEILENYLNLAYFGDGAWGINAAAFHYFSVSPADLTPKQSATLAGLVKNPDEFNPNVFPEKALQRRNTVLAVMAREGAISQDEAEELQTEDLALKIKEYPNGCVESVGAFSCDYIRRYLLKDEALGETEADRQQALERGGLTIKSTIDPDKQKAANEAVRTTVAAQDRALGLMAMVEPGTGQVLSLAQSRPMGRDEAKGQTFLNFTVPTAFGDSGGFPAGSTFKMFTAAAALKEGISPNEVISSPPDVTIPAGSYFDCEGGGTDEFEVSNSTTSGAKNMYSGLSESVNTYFAKLEQRAGLCNVVRTAESMGITVPFPDEESALNNQVPSFTLGVTDVSPLTMAAAYAVPASGGMYCEPQPVTEILDRDGEVLKTYERNCERVLPKEDAAQINDILRIVQETGFGAQNGTGLNVPSAAKTGTAQDNKAVSYAGYTPQVSTFSMIAGVKENGSPNSLAGVTINDRPLNFASVGGSSLAGPMWKKAMGAIQGSLDPAQFDPPPARRQAAAAAPAPAQAEAPAPRGDDNRGGDEGGDEGDDD
ncbi:transglycosylase domain-containing protein [Aeromicrobium sp. CF3.5]|uniref:transglycosylase domain-containing protein n=1 Tax=Aeromicrobium sp. CF3.5 TaxID=3373078 RepID=UPI003EE79F4D